MATAMTMDEWSVSDYLVHFEKEIGAAAASDFKAKFHALAGELELLDSEFLHVSKGCGKAVDPVIDRLHSIAGRLRYCERPRGFESDCDKLYADVQGAIDAVRSFREQCSG